jgi:anti-anti-sigma factor
LTSEPVYAIIRLAGELEIGRRDEIRRALQIQGSKANILIDCSEATYADSTALAELFRFRNEANEHRQRVAILIGNQQFERIVQYAGLAGAFELFDDRSAALAYLTDAEAP